MTTIKEASTAFCYLNEARRLIGHQPKYLIERGEPQDILGRSPGVANDNQLAWPFIPFPEDWSGI
jgi:hypothetical protein